MNTIYTPKEAALEILSERRSDPDIRGRVMEYLGGSVPAACFLSDQPLAFLARYVPRATDEDRLFADEARSAGLIPYWASYVEDRYTVRNPEKVETIRPPIRWQKGQRTRQWVVEPENRAGSIGELETIYGYSSCDYQQGLRGLVFARDGNQDIQDNTFDMTSWYRDQAPRFGYEGGNLAAFYYPATMALATTMGVLYEDFDGGPNASNGDLAKFMRAVVRPAIDKVTSDLGLAPIIVRLPYIDKLNETGLEFLGADEGKAFRAIGSRAVLSAKIGS